MADQKDGQFIQQYTENQQYTHAQNAMKKHYNGNNNVRPTAPLHNLKLQIDRLEWYNQRRMEGFSNTLLKATINELKSVLTQLSNPSKAFTIWTHPETVQKIEPSYTWPLRTPFFSITWKNGIKHYRPS